MNEREVFIAALQLESRAERQAYLDDACGDDLTLRRQVEALLKTHDRAGNFLQEPVFGFVAAALHEHSAWTQRTEAVLSQTDPSEDKSPETEGERPSPSCRPWSSWPRRSSRTNWAAWGTTACCVC